jgi:hypothetical protein
MFSLLNDDAPIDAPIDTITTIQEPVKVLYDENGNMDIEAMLPEYKELSDALKSGKSWYDIMYPSGDNTPNNVIPNNMQATNMQATNMQSANMQTNNTQPQEDEWQAVTLPKKRKAEHQNTSSKRPRYN